MGGSTAADFDYDLPQNAIAQHPIEPRHAAQMLVAGPKGSTPQHCTVEDLPDQLDADDLVVVNETRVLPARLMLKKSTGGVAEVLLLEPVGDEWQALVKPGRRLPVGTVLQHNGEPVVEIVDQFDDGRRLVRLLVHDLAEEVGEIPLPPYITEPLADPERYQTVFANEPGSVAAPTAGLHLTQEVLHRLATKGVSVERVELRVGLGTFRPLGDGGLDDHVMHRETYRVDGSVWSAVQEAKSAGRRVVAVGTTVVRTLESVAISGELEGATELFIRRGHQWQVVDRLLTNFHVPRSSLLVLVDAFIGDRWRDLYAEAIDRGYRMLSFGDAMLLDRDLVSEAEAED